MLPHCSASCRFPQSARRPRAPRWCGDVRRVASAGGRLSSSIGGSLDIPPAGYDRLPGAQLLVSVRNWPGGNYRLRRGLKCDWELDFEGRPMTFPRYKTDLPVQYTAKLLHDSQPESCARDVITFGHHRTDSRPVSNSRLMSRESPGRQLTRPQRERRPTPEQIPQLRRRQYA